MEKMTLYWFWNNREKVNFSLNSLYENRDLTKQAMHDWLSRQIVKEEEWHQMIPLIYQIREEHPGMSSRVMHYLLRPQTMGRDKFIKKCIQEGFEVETKRSATRTTNSLGVIKFPNLIKNCEVTHVNQIWVSDITYYRIRERFYYLTFIMDLKSRFIVGHSVSKNLRTEDTTLAALKNALKCFLPGKGLTLHSDGGGQYYCKEFLKLTGLNKIKNSMTEDTGENNHAERLNGTIKNKYLSYYMPTNYTELEKQTSRAVYNYNYGKPHESLSKATPWKVYALINNSGVSQNKIILKNTSKTVKAI